MRGSALTRRLGRLRWVRKAQIVRRHDARVRDHIRYVLTDPELDNFTYELANEPELVDWLARNFAVDAMLVRALLEEARTNPALHGRLREATRRRAGMKTSPGLGRRLGWYVVVRLVKPELMVETGIHDGIGSLVLLSALDRNAVEGSPGRLVSFDVDPGAGWVVGEHPRWDRRIEDTRTGLAAVGAHDLFLHDSLHTYEHERMELELAAAAGALLMTDNANTTDALKELCAERGLRFEVFKERPSGHFYPGAWLAIGFPPSGRH